MHPSTGLVRELCAAAVDDLSWATDREKKQLQKLVGEKFVVLSLAELEKLQSYADPHTNPVSGIRKQGSRRKSKG